MHHLFIPRSKNLGLSDESWDHQPLVAVSLDQVHTDTVAGGPR